MPERGHDQKRREGRIGDKNNYGDWMSQVSVSYERQKYRERPPKSGELVRRIGD